MDDSGVSSFALCAFFSDNKSPLKIGFAGEGGHEGKEDMTVIQEMITTLQVTICLLFQHLTNSPFPVCEGRRAGYGEESLYDPVD